MMERRNGPGRPPVMNESRPRVAIVGADAATLKSLEPLLCADGLDMLALCPADFSDFRAIAPWMRDRGVVAVVYELGLPPRRERKRFEALYAAIVQTGTPMLISTLARWRQEGQAMAAGAIGDEEAAFAHFLRGVRRAIGCYVPRP